VRLLARLVTVTTASAPAGAVAPAAADHQCPPSSGIFGDSFCVVTHPLTIPAGTPVLGPVGAGPLTVPGPLLCDTSTGECRGTFVHLPGAYVSSSGTTVATLTIPGYGVSTREPAVYYGVPSTGGGSGTPLGVTILGTIPLNPVDVVAELAICPSGSHTHLGGVHVVVDDCTLSLEISL
jgi:hypothetical protein